MSDFRQSSCARCGENIQGLTQSTGEQIWSHLTPGADHQAIPVPAAPDAAECTFCPAKRAAWRFPDSAIEGETVYACATCKDLIDAGDRDGLIKQGELVLREGGIESALPLIAYIARVGVGRFITIFLGSQPGPAIAVTGEEGRAS